jgi:hypothetical protein
MSISPSRELSEPRGRPSGIWRSSHDFILYASAISSDVRRTVSRTVPGIPETVLPRLGGSLSESDVARLVADAEVRKSGLDPLVADRQVGLRAIELPLRWSPI